jgi:WD40 repeat protein
LLLCIIIHHFPVLYLNTLLKVPFRQSQVLQTSCSLIKLMDNVLKDRCDIFYADTVSVCPCSCLWDLEAGKRSLEFEAHSGDVVSISLSPDSKSYVTGSVDKSCRLWDLRDEKPKQTFFGHTADVNSVCVSHLSLGSIRAVIHRHQKRIVPRGFVSLLSLSTHLKNGSIFHILSFTYLVFNSVNASYFML